VGAQIAILLSGYIREPQFDSLARNIVAPNVAAGNKIFIYASTWDTQGKVIHVDTHSKIFTGVEYWSGAVRSYDNAPIDKPWLESELSRLSAGKFAVRYSNYATHAEEWLSQLRDRHGFERGKDEHTILRIKGMWFGMKDVFDLVKRPETYDVMMRCRFDIKFQDPVVVMLRRPFFKKHRMIQVGNREYDLDALTNEDNPHISRVRGRTARGLHPRHTLLVPRRENAYIDDWFAVGTASSMGAHMSAYASLDDYFDQMRQWPEPFESESIVVLNALKKRIGLTTFPKTMYQ